MTKEFDLTKLSPRDRSRVVYARIIWNSIGEVHGDGTRGASPLEIAAKVEEALRSGEMPYLPSNVAAGSRIRNLPTVIEEKLDEIMMFDDSGTMVKEGFRYYCP